jgi:hypothetical protein
MKKMLAVVAMVACVATVARADFYEYSVTTATGAVTTVSDQIPISGYLDRVEIIQTAGRTNSFTIASYDGTTAVDTVVSVSALATATDVIRPRVIGTTTAGVNLAPAVQDGSDAVTNNVGTALIAAYERPLVGGNLKVSILGDAANVATTAVKVRFYFERFQR